MFVLFLCKHTTSNLRVDENECMISTSRESMTKSIGSTSSVVLLDDLNNIRHRIREPYVMV